MEGYVYFIQEADQGAVKTGFTVSNPFQRLMELQTGNSCKLSLVGAIWGDSSLERSIHKLYKHLRIRGEWFKAEILTFFDTLDSVDLNKLETDFCVKKKLKSENNNFLHHNIATLTENINLSELARTIGMSKSLLADWSRARRTPSGKNMHNVLKLAKYFGISFEDLFFKKINNCSQKQEEL